MSRGVQATTSIFSISYMFLIKYRMAEFSTSTMDKTQDDTGGFTGVL